MGTLKLFCEQMIYVIIQKMFHETQWPAKMSQETTHLLIYLIW